MCAHYCRFRISIFLPISVVNIRWALSDLNTQDIFYWLIFIISQNQYQFYKQEISYLLKKIFNSLWNNLFNSKPLWLGKGALDLSRVMFDSHVFLPFFFFLFLFSMVVFSSANSMQKYPPFINVFSSIFEVNSIWYEWYCVVHVCMHGMRFFFDNIVDKFREQVVKYNYFVSSESMLTFKDNNSKLVRLTFVVSFHFLWGECHAKVPN